MDLQNKNLASLDSVVKEKEKRIEEVLDTNAQKMALIQTLQSNQEEIVKSYESKLTIKGQLEHDILRKNQELIESLNACKASMNTQTAKHLNSLKKT